MTTQELLAYLKEYLNVDQIPDYCVNGLQVEGKAEIHRLITGVSAGARLFQHALRDRADAVLVHHGLFWKGSAHPFHLTGVLRDRVKLLLDGNINLLAYHLPLDAHPQIGNNAVLAQHLQLGDLSPFDVGFVGQLPAQTGVDGLVERVRECCGGSPWVFPYGPKKIERVAVISGGGADRVESAAETGAQALVTGNPTEPSVRTAEEIGIHLIAAGHYNTERFGVSALARHLAERFGIEAEFVDVPNDV